MQRETYGLWIIVSVVLTYLGGSREAIAQRLPRRIAQIVPDETLPVNSTIDSTVTPNGNILTIDGGTAAGGNLFHSFQDFNVPINDIAHFNNALTIDNIITRVTGGNISNIDGIIRANGTANLFLINPAGLMFGPNASLDIGGSFVGSTAQALQFEDGNFYSAVDVDAPPLLTVNVPVGLQFGPEPGDIDVAGGGHNLRLARLPFALKDRDTPGIIFREERTLGLQVQPDRTLALVGGNINFDGGNLTAESGRIELGSVAGNSTVTLAPIEAGWQLGYEGVEQFGDLHLLNAASIDTSGAGSGAVQIQGRSLSLTDGSAIVALTLGDEAGEDIAIRTTDSVEFVGVSSEGEIRSGILADVQWRATGNGPTVTIETGRLQLIDSARISASTYGTGRGGDINITARESIDLMGALDDSSRLLAEVGLDATGNGGNISIESPRVRVRDIGIVSTKTEGHGRGGNLRIDATESVELRNRGVIRTASERDSRGNSGNFTLETDRLIVFEKGSILATTQGEGNAGNITIEATESIELTDSSIETTTTRRSTGRGGTIAVTTNILTLLRGGRIASTTIGEGNAGDLIVSAGTIDIRGVGIDGQGRRVPSRLEAQVNGPSLGKGGNLTVRADRLTLRDGGRISAATFSSGNAGNLDITASQIELSRGRQDFFDGLPAGLVVGVTEKGTGNAGNLIIQADRLIVRDGMEISVSSQGEGAAGNLQIDASEVFLDRGILNAETARGNIGDITLNTFDLRLRNRSQITTNAMGPSTGGNITILTDTLTALENSDITANAEASLGGRVDITSQSIFGTQFREQLTPESDITATSKLGIQFSGTVNIQTPDVDPSSGLLELPDTPIDATALIGQDPCRHGDRSEFVNIGRGGVPPTPRGELRGESGWVQLVTLNSSVVPVTSDAIPQPQPTRLVEAQGWIIEPDGTVILTANPPTVTPHGNGQFRATCQSSEFGEDG